jgi:hypothetical protein
VSGLFGGAVGVARGGGPPSRLGRLVDWASGRV